jgi:hypothetical protein
MTSNSADNQLVILETALLAIPKSKILLTSDWKNTFPSEPGVYLLMDVAGVIIYVGETGNLRGRMNDLRDSRHHTLRRKIGKKYYEGQSDYITASVSKKFPPRIEALVDRRLKKLLISVLVVEFGRKEFEEFLINKHHAQIFNSRRKR